MCNSLAECMWKFVVAFDLKVALQLRSSHMPSVHFKAAQHEDETCLLGLGRLSHGDAMQHQLLQVDFVILSVQSWSNCRISAVHNDRSFDVLVNDDYSFAHISAVATRAVLLDFWGLSHLCNALQCFTRVCSRPMRRPLDICTSAMLTRETSTYTWAARSKTCY